MLKFCPAFKVLIVQTIVGNDAARRSFSSLLMVVVNRVVHPLMPGHPNLSIASAATQAVHGLNGLEVQSMREACDRDCSMWQAVNTYWSRGFHSLFSHGGAEWVRLCFLVTDVALPFLMRSLTCYVVSR